MSSVKKIIRYRGFEFTIEGKTVGRMFVYSIVDTLGVDDSSVDLHLTFEDAIRYEKEKIDNHMTNLEKA